MRRKTCLLIWLLVPQTGTTKALPTFSGTTVAFTLYTFEVRALLIITDEITDFTGSLFKLKNITAERCGHEDAEPIAISLQPETCHRLRQTILVEMDQSLWLKLPPKASGLAH